MKKVSLIMGALALVLGLSQCRKPNAPVFNLGDGVVRHVTFTADGDNGTKGQFDVNASNGLDYKWDADATISVYEGASGVYTKKVGELTNPAISEDGYTATFSGDLEISEGATKLRFVHLGSGISGTSVSFAEQNGTLDEIAAKVIGVCEVDVNETNTYSGNLTLPFAIAKFNVSSFGTETGSDVVVKNANKTTMTIDEVGNVTFSGNTTVTMKGVKTNTTEFYMMAAPGNTTLKFSGNGKDASKSANIVANKFYTNGGAAIAIESNPMYIEGGEFSVAAGKKVIFSRGNLFYVNGDWSYRDNQYDFYTCPGHQCVVNGVFDEDGTPSNTYGSFAWSLGSYNNYGVNVNGGGELPGGYSFAEWGKLIDGDARTLTVEEWDYLFKTRPDAANLYKYAQFDEGKWAALIILPDGTNYTEAFAAFDGWIYNEVSDLDAIVRDYKAVILPNVGSRAGNDTPAVSVGGWFKQDGVIACQWLWTSKVEGNLPCYYYIQYNATPKTYSMYSQQCSYGIGYGVRTVHDVK